MKGPDTRNTHVQYESSFPSGLIDMAKVKVFLFARTHTDADARAMTLSPQTFVLSC